MQRELWFAQGQRTCTEPTKVQRSHYQPLSIRSSTYRKQWRCTATDKPSTSQLEVLKNAEAIDRLRYQARLVFDRFDHNKDGMLNTTEVNEYLAYSAAKRQRLASPAMAESLHRPEAELESQHEEAQQYNGNGGGARLSFDQFLRMVRQQHDGLVRDGAAHAKEQFNREELMRLRLGSSLRDGELAALYWLFKLMDFDDDGQLVLSELQTAGGIEAQIVDAKLEDADADDDGRIDFGEFLSSYARPRPTILNFLILVANTALVWAILNSPLEPIWKSLGVGVLVLLPQLVSRPVILVYETAVALMGKSRAEGALSRAARADSYRAKPA